ncbi:MAG TPA: transposase [Alphaproteobacteria bacterium]|jgi:transposase|nr:transposase [Alphaproteobacteria bacterium]
MAAVRRRVFPEAFKREAVEKAATSGLSTAMIAAEIGVHETMLRRWMLQFSSAGEIMTSHDRLPVSAAATFPPAGDLAAENARLRAEVARLRDERETLKKALAILFAELK